MTILTGLALWLLIAAIVSVFVGSIFRKMNP